MSGQYPGGYNSPVGGHRGNFGNQQQQMVNMNQMVQNQMGMMGGYNPGVGAGMMQQQQNSLQSQVMGGIVPPVMSSAGMQSSSPIQQQQQSPNQQALLVQQQLQQQQLQQQMQQQMPQPSPQNQQQQQAVTSVGQTPHLSLQTSSTPSGSGVSIMQQSMGQSSNMLAITQPLPHKEINIVALSRLGQETVQDITSRFQEIFAALKVVQPSGSNRENSAEKKVQEYLRTIRLLFKRVRIIYEKCNDGYPQGMEYTHVESLIPYKDEPDHRSEPTQCEEYRKALQENRELVETVMLKNKQLREIIDRIRIIIWEINTMLSMRRS